MDSQVSILIVDDEPDLLENIKLPLEIEGYQVFAASNGLEALKILESRPVGLILTDIAMPDMNGYQLYERICENPHWAMIPFIFLTARTLDSDIRYGKELGVDDYLPKPIRNEDLLAIVRGKLRRAQQLSASIAKINGTNHARQPADDGDRFISLGSLRIDAQQHRVWISEEEISLSAKEFALLEYLARQHGRIASPQELIRVTHEFETDNVEAGSLLRPLILSIRRKLGSAVGDMGLIKNVRGVGYRLDVSGT